MLRRRSSWTVILKGAAVTVLLFVPIAVLVVVLERFLLAGMTRHEQAFAGVLVVTGGSILAFATGGWVVGRAIAFRNAGGVLVSGFLAAVAAVVVLVGLTYAVLGEMMDFHSVGVALGLTEIPNADLTRLPFPSGPAGRDDELNPPDLARMRTLTSIAFLLAWAALALTAATLGALASASRRPLLH